MEQVENRYTEEIPEIKGIRGMDQEVVSGVYKRWDSLCKPLGSLGRLEEMVARFGGIRGSVMPDLGKKAVVVMAADNGVVAEGVTQTGQEVTLAVVENMTVGRSTVCVMAKRNGADVVPVDIGMVADAKGEGVWRRKVRYGTGNIARGKAMSREEAVRAVRVGIAVVQELVDRGYGILATGEMGIGNTTTSSAVCSVLLGQDVEVVTGRGAGLTSEALAHKIEVIRESIRVNRPDSKDPLDVLAKVGGLDIAGLVGCFLGAAVYRVPIFVDGFISSVAALLAVRMVPRVADYLFPSHCSKEPAGRMVLEALQLVPYLYADMCLGEGTGAVMGLEIADYALACYREIPSFVDNKIEEYVPLM